VSAKRKGASSFPAPDYGPVDPAHFDEFYLKFFLPLVRRAAWKHGLDKEDARDVVQEAFMVALTKLDPHRNPKAWLIQVVDHLSANFRRKLTRRARLTSTWCSDTRGAEGVVGDGEIADDLPQPGGDYY
jgi:DNA-directed RNA polymerase specialized sigma24 family protein